MLLKCQHLCGSKLALVNEYNVSVALPVRLIDEEEFKASEYVSV